MTGDRDFGPQPIATLMHGHGLAPADLVAASGEQLTFKAVQRAMKGRWLTPNMRGKVARALAARLGRHVAPAELFNYD